MAQTASGSEPEDDGTITITVQRSQLVAAVGATAVYAELVLVQQVPAVSATAVSALTLALGWLRRQ
ncbi:hypothetical protein ACTWJ8_40685 (plasmid) [Streptomyces sp. SDT5-1]|uniref:hypothetical protein n=1 Tax=Streptomyces sp. SDT5-1 TaxID=3406418 RepID=UPI003FD0A349